MGGEREREGAIVTASLMFAIEEIGGQMFDL